MNAYNDSIFSSDGIEYKKISELAQIDPTKFDRLRETLIIQFMNSHQDQYGNLKLLQERIETKISQKSISIDMQFDAFFKEPMSVLNEDHRAIDPTGARFMHHAIPRD